MRIVLVVVARSRRGVLPVPHAGRWVLRTRVMAMAMAMSWACTMASIGTV